METHPPGTRIGRFEVVGQPLIGDMSIVYICFDRERSHPIALKTLQPEYSSHAALDRFSQEGAVWADLGAHPHIVRCHEVFQPKNSSNVYLVLDLVVWEKDRVDASLRAWLAPGQPLPVLQALLFGLQIARGMQGVTAQLPGFVHRDLKPDNVLVGAGRLSQADVNRLGVGNFGLVAVLQAGGGQAAEVLKTEKVPAQRTQLTHGIVGTPLYMAPEQWRGEELTLAIDVYALGCMLHEMLAGQQAVTGQSVEALQRAHCAGEVRSLPSSLPMSVDALVAHCLASEPEKRYQSWEAVETAIAAAYEELVGYPVPAAEPTAAPSQAERVLVGWFYNEMGYLCNATGKTRTAVDCCERAVRVGRSEGDRRLVGAAMGNLGEAYRRQGDAHRAIEHHEQALAIARETGDRQGEGAALNNIGIAYLQLGNPQQAIGYHEQALAIARAIGHRQGESAALVNLGNVYHQLGDLRRSIQYHEQELEIAREIGSRYGESIALGNLGGLYADLSDIRRAMEYQEQALTIKAEIGDRHGQVAGLTNLGNAYRNLGDAQRAMECYGKALEAAREMGDRRGEGLVLNNLGSVYSNIGDMRRSIEYHEQALEIIREAGDRRSEGECLTNLGYAYMSLKDTGRAMECCKQALAIDHEIGDMMGVALDSFNMANLLAQQGRFSEALPYAEESAKILDQVGQPVKARQAHQVVADLRAEIH